MRPSLIIGIGGTGLSIGHALKYLCHTLLPDNEKDKVKFLFFENDKKQFRDRADLLHHDPELLDPRIEQKEIVPLTNFQPYYISKKIEKFHKKEARLDEKYKELEKWFDPTITIMPQVYDDGLAANRMIGRMCGYEYADTIRNKIREAGEEIKNILRKEGRAIDENALNVYIIASNSGGTGSSLFFDLSLLVDDIFNNETLMISKALIFVSPNYFLGQKLDKGFNQSSSEYKNLQINSWAFIDECEYFLKEFNSVQSLMGKYFSRPSYLSSKVAGGVIFSPFTSAIIFDQTTSTGTVIPNRKLYTAIGEILFYTLTSASNEKFNSEFLRNKFKKPKDGTKTESDQNMAYNYSTIGIKTVRFPEEEFTEYFSSRYIYEVFKKLLNENPNPAVIEKKAEEFVDEVFKNYQSGKNELLKITERFRGDLNQNRLTSSEIFKEEFLTNPTALFKEEKGEKFKDEGELRNIFSNNTDLISNFKKQVEQEFKDLERTNYIGFNEEYNNRRNAADEIRERLWEIVFDLILQEGYYAVTGVVSGTFTTKGFLENVKVLLSKLFLDFVNDYIKIDIYSIESRLNELQEVIIKKSKGKLFGTNNVTEAKNEIVEYFRSWEELRETLINKYELIIKQKILYEFAVGDYPRDILKNSVFPNKLYETDLTKYEKDIQLRIGITSTEEYKASLIKEFDDNKKDTTTIKNNYIRHLRSKYRETDKDVFTKYLPYTLMSLLDENTEDGWKKNNPLDKLFKDNVFRKEGKITKQEFESILSGYDKDTIILMVARLKKDNRTNLQLIIEEIKEKVNKYFNDSYVNNSQSEIGKYLSQSIQEVILGLQQKEKLQLVSELREIEYPINSASVAAAMPVGPYLNIHSELESFAKTVLGIDDKMIITNSALKKNVITSVVYKQDIPYESINQNNIHFEVYKNRDLKTYRPFLDKNWNEHVRGPKDAEDTALKTVMIKIKKDQKLKYFELLALSIGIDLVLQKDLNLRKQLFITAPKIIEKQNLVNRSIIYYDFDRKQFVYNRNVTVDKNYKLLIKEGLTDEDKAQELLLSLDEDKKLLSFNDSLNKLIYDNKFNDLLNSFGVVLTQHFNEIKSSLNNNINEIETGFYNVAKKIYNFNEQKEFEEMDLKMAQEFDEIMRKVLTDVFNL